MLTYGPSSGLGQGRFPFQRVVMEPEKEKRRFPRLDSVNLVSYTQLDKDNNPVDMGMCKSLDLSLGGVTIRVHRSFDVNSCLEMVMALGDKLIRSSGRVVHVRRVGKDLYDVGVCFTQVEEGDRAVIENFFRDKTHSDPGNLDD